MHFARSDRNRELVVCFAFVFDFFEFSFYEIHGFLALCLPQSAPPCEIIDRSRGVSTEVHPSQLHELFFSREDFRIFHPLVEKDEGLFFVCRRSEAYKSASRSIACEVIGPLCLHGDSSCFESIAKRSTSQRLASAELSFDDLECFLCMTIGDREKFPALHESWKRLRSTECEHPVSIRGIHIVECPTHRPSTDDAPISTGFAYHIFPTSLYPRSDHPCRLSYILSLDTSIVPHDLRGSRESRMVESVGYEAMREEVHRRYLLGKFNLSMV